MKIALLAIFALCACGATQDKSPEPAMPLAGTWKLISGTLIEKGDTVTTEYAGNNSFIKIINATHFAFLQHDLKKVKDSSAFSAGGGRYSLRDSLYTEYLEYCSDRNWEGNNFPFTVRIQQDTLVQTGVEKVASAGVDRINIEKYVRISK